jgi:hypothetical protein
VRRWLCGFETLSRPTRGTPTMGVAVVKSYREVVSEYLVHREAKSLAPGGDRSGWHTVGLLERRPMVTEDVAYIGKEANELDDSLAGQIRDEAAVLNTYGAEIGDWEATLPLLFELPRNWLIEKSGVDRSSIHRYLSGTTRPRRRRQEELRELVERWHGTR